MSSTSTSTTNFSTLLTFAMSSTEPFRRYALFFVTLSLATIAHASYDLCPGRDDVFVNVGGNNFRGYRCDAAGGGYFSNPSRALKLPKLVNVTGNCTSQYESARTSTTNLVYSIPIPESNVSYPVSLMFRETDPTVAIGDRVFSVTVNEKVIDTSLDIMKKVRRGQPFILHAGRIVAINNVIKVTLVPVAGHPILSGIAIVGANASKIIGNTGLTSCAAPTAAPVARAKYDTCPGPNDLFINVGSLEKFKGFRCDTGAYASESLIDTKDGPSAIKGDCVKQYTSCRFSVNGTLSFNIPVPPGKYKVMLGFAEIYAPRRRGERVFNVFVNNQLISKSLDITAEVGHNTPYIVTANTSSRKNLINIEIVPLVGHPMLSSIGISGLSGDSKANALARSTGLDSCAASGTTQFLPIHKIIRNLTLPDIGLCPEPGDVFINAGGSHTDENFRCDIDDYYTRKGLPRYPMGKGAIANVTVVHKGVGCIDQYRTYRFSKSGDLIYNIPVAPGKYSVYLMFMESIQSNRKGSRMFSITVNKQSIPNGFGRKLFDIVALAGGVNLPYIVSVPNVATEGEITITIGRSKGDPFISGIGVKGTGAAEVLGTTGLQTCRIPAKKPQRPKDCSLVRKKAITDFSVDTAAHAVSGGPYVVQDYDKTGNESVELDGLGSHSHSTEFRQVHIITTWIWRWQDTKNALADNETGTVTMVGPTPIPQFPLGKTDLTLEVVDTACNRAIHRTTVTVNPSAKPGAYCYFYDMGVSESELMPIPKNILDGVRPTFARDVGDINFMEVADYKRLKVPFTANSFAVRCIFSVIMKTAMMIPYKVAYNGLVEVYHNDELVLNNTKYGSNVSTVSSSGGIGLQHWEVLYFRKQNRTASAELKFLDVAGVPLPAETVRHDAATTIPVLERLSKLSGIAGNDVVLFGSAFVNGVQVKFGDEIAETIDGSANRLTVRVPEKQGNESTVDVVVMTNAGVSNGITFTYGQLRQPCAQMGFVQDTIKKGRKKYEIGNGIAVCKFGPDGRLYFGSLFNLLYAITLDKDVQVTHECRTRVPGKLERAVLGIAFDPTDVDIRMYFSTSTYEWRKTNPPKISEYTKGWTNGKIQSIMVERGGCFNDSSIRDIVTGLPVSNHDHTVSWIEFLPNGNMLISVGGFTNGGVEHPAMGGDPANLLSGAIVECPKSGYDIKWTNLTHPAESKLVTPPNGTTPCTVYAAGIRNSFGGHLHTNGEVYASDNGPNPEYGNFSLNCWGGTTEGKFKPDRLLKLQKGKCHGHPNLTRGRMFGRPEECVMNSPKCVAPLVDNLPSSSNGVIEYRSNLFVGELKGDLLISEYSAGGTGLIGRVELDKKGNREEYYRKFQADSGLSIAEGPRGEIVMARVHKSTFLVMRPVCRPQATVTYLIGVHPKRGAWIGGQTVLITGFNFGDTPLARFGAEYCTNVKVIDTTAFTCVTPKGTPNTQVKVVVHGITGENVPTKGTDYWYW